MKKLIFILLASILIGFFTNEAESQYHPGCEPGFNEGSMWVINYLMENGLTCDMQVFYCWKDDANGNRYS